MDPLLLIIKYLFNEKNIPNNDETIESFFDNGISFPLFISLTFNVDKIPGVIKIPKTLFHKKINNDTAIQFLFQKDENIKKICPTCESYKDKVALLSNILIKHCFKIDECEILKKFNLIVNQFGIFCKTKKDFVKISNLQILIDCLTGKQIESSSENQDDVYELLKLSLEKLNIPLVINKDSINVQNQYQFFIQIEIIFGKFKEKINSIISNQNKSSYLDDKSAVNKKEPPSNEQASENQITKEESDKNASEEKFSSEPKLDDQKDTENIKLFISEKQNRSTSFINHLKEIKSNQISIYSIQEKSILKTLNSIGLKGGFQFKSFSDAIYNDSLPKFVMFYLNIKSINNVYITNSSIETNNSDLFLTEEQVKNINEVIEFLKTKNKKFEILIFNFQNPLNIESSANLFYSNFLNFYFVKNSKTEIYQRYSILFCTHYDFTDINEILDLKYNVFIGLLHFLTTGNLHFDFNFTKLITEEEKATKYFDKAKIPMIINSSFFDIKWEVIPDCYFYQLQFIYDALDSSPPSRKIVESFMNSIYKLKKLHLPNFKEFLINMKEKNYLLKNQKDKYNSYLNRNDFQDHLDKQIKVDKKIVRKPSTYKNRHEKIRKNDELIFDSSSESQSQTLKKIESFDQFWNQSSKKFIYDNGVIIEENKIQQPEMKTKWENEIRKNDELIFDSSSESQSQTLKKIESFDQFWNQSSKKFIYDNGVIIEENKIQQPEMKTKWENEIIEINKKLEKIKPISNQEFLFAKTKTKTESKLYKLFYYDELNNKWNFNENVYQQFFEDKKLQNFKTSLILYLNSNENELIELNTNLIKGLYPKLEEDQIYVYALCDQALSMLNFQIDFNSYFKNSIKPIFLLLHVPKGKATMPNIELIVYQIYSFLLIICQTVVVILSKNFYLHQITFNRIMQNVNQHFRPDEHYFIFSDVFNQSTESDSILKFNENELIDEILIESNENLNKNDQSNNDNDNQFFKYIQPDLILLINDIDTEFNQLTDESINENYFFKNIQDQFICKSKMHYINTKDSNTYSCFLSTLGYSVVTKLIDYTKINLNFQIFNRYLSENSMIFINLKIFCDEFPNELKKLVHKRYSMIKNSIEYSNESTIHILFKLHKEISSIPPFYDDNFISECNSCSRELLKDEISKYKDFIQNELEISSESHVNFFEDSLNEKYFWRKNHIGIIIDTYNKFIEEEFFDIIKSLCPENFFTFVYQSHLNILECQKKKWHNAIIDKFNSFIDIRSSTNIQNIQESINKGTNYALKETENLREIKVEVQIDKDLKSEIEQDF